MYEFLNKATCGDFLRGGMLGSICTCSYPVTFSQCKRRAPLGIGFEELVGEVLSEESKHQAGSLWVWNKLSPHEELLSQHLGIRKLLFTCGGRKK